MSTHKASLILVVLMAGVALTQAAGGIKGQRADDSQQRQQTVKGLRPPSQQQQQAYLPPPPPPSAPAKGPAQQFRPIPQQASKGAGQVAPVFTAAKVQPVALPPPPPPAPAAQVIIQQVEQQQQQQQQQEPEQQQETEIDPNAAAQDSAPAILAPAAAAPAASEEEANPRPEPYAFNYAFESGDSATSGSSQREEQQDASGKVTGFYTLKGEDGRDRRVDYVADANGFRATISTNELGTSPKNSADVDWQAQSPSDAQLRAAESATQAARQRALLSPQSAASGQSLSSASKISSPRQSFAASKAAIQQQQVAQPSANIAQLQEPFEQIRQVELKGRARKSRHAPFYLLTV